MSAFCCWDDVYCYIQSIQSVQQQSNELCKVYNNKA